MLTITKYPPPSPFLSLKALGNQEACSNPHAALSVTPRNASLAVKMQAMEKSSGGRGEMKAGRMALMGWGWGWGSIDAGWRLESVLRSMRLWGIFINPVFGTDSHNGQAES